MNTAGPSLAKALRMTDMTPSREAEFWTLTTGGKGARSVSVTIRPACEAELLSPLFDYICWCHQCHRRRSGCKRCQELQSRSVLQRCCAEDQALEDIVRGKLSHVHDDRAGDVRSETQEQSSDSFVAGDSNKAIETVAVRKAVGRCLVQITTDANQHKLGGVTCRGATVSDGRRIVLTFRLSANLAQNSVPSTHL